MRIEPHRKQYLKPQAERNGAVEFACYADTPDDVYYGRRKNIYYARTELKEKTTLERKILTVKSY